MDRGGQCFGLATYRGIMGLAFLQELLTGEEVEDPFFMRLNQDGLLLERILALAVPVKIRCFFLLPPRFFSFKAHHLQVSTKDGWAKNTKQRSFENEKKDLKHNGTKSIFCASIQFH